MTMMPEGMALYTLAAGRCTSQPHLFVFGTLAGCAMCVLGAQRVRYGCYYCYDYDSFLGEFLAMKISHTSENCCPGGDCVGARLNRAQRATSIPFMLCLYHTK